MLNVNNNAVVEVLNEETKPLLRSLDVDKVMPPTPMTLFSIITGSYLNVLLPFIPLALASSYFEWNPTTTFTLSLLALVPLAAMLGEATEVIAAKTSDAVAALLNVSMGNLPELIVSVAALHKRYYRLIQVTLLGSIVSNALFVVGLSHMAGAFKQKTIKLNRHFVSSCSGMLVLSAITMMIPAILDLAGEGQRHADINISRYAALILVLMYGVYLVFQFQTHKHLFEESPEDAPDICSDISLTVGISWLVVVTSTITVLCALIVQTLEASALSWNISTSFMGFVVIPLANNAAEHACAISIAWKGKMNLSLGIAMGSATQLALFCVPVMVLGAWSMDLPLSMAFQGFETAVCFGSVMLITTLLADGESNYLKGAMLVGAYSIFGVAFFLHTSGVES